MWNSPIFQCWYDGSRAVHISLPRLKRERALHIGKEDVHCSPRPRIGREWNQKYGPNIQRTNLMWHRMSSTSPTQVVYTAKEMITTYTYSCSVGAIALSASLMDLYIAQPTRIAARWIVEFSMIYAHVTKVPLSLPFDKATIIDEKNAILRDDDTSDDWKRLTTTILT